MKIGLGYNAVPASAEKELVKVFRSGQFSPGLRVREFEEQFAKLHGAKYGVFVNSGTDALRIALAAMKEQYRWKDGDRVAVPALTFVATVNVILQNNLTPFFVDVGMNDYLINPWNLERRNQNADGSWDETLKAVMPVHLFGRHCEKAIYELAQKRKLKVLEDSCETILNPVLGEVSCHSTYMAHHVATGVGGVALTNDSFLHTWIRSLANHGRSTYYIPGYDTAKISQRLLIENRFVFDRVGYSSRATEFEAVLGLSQLPDVKKNVEKRREIAGELWRVLNTFEDLALSRPEHEDNHTFMMFPIVLSEKSKVDRWALCTALEKAGIETRPMMPITNQDCYKHLFKDPTGFSVARDINEKGFYIPCHPGMGEKEVAHVAKTFRSFFKAQTAALDRVAEVV